MHNLKRILVLAVLALAVQGFFHAAQAQYVITNTGWSRTDGGSLAGLTWDGSNVNSRIAGVDINLTGTISIQTRNLILDGRGHTLTSLAPLTGIGIDVTPTLAGGTILNVTIKNFAGISGFASGIKLENPSRALSGCVIKGNTITGCTVGIDVVVLTSSGNGLHTIDSNQVVGNTTGISIVGLSSPRTTTNKIINNTLQNNSGNALYLSYASGTLVYHNNFINNNTSLPLPHGQVSEINGDGSTVFNQDPPVGGNYWSDSPSTAVYYPYYPTMTPADSYPWATKDGWNGGPTLDLTPPVTTASLSGTAGAGDVYSTDVTITLTAIDNESGVAATEYQLNGAGWISYTGQFAVTAEGLTTVQFRSKNNDGIWESPKQVLVTIDKPGITASAGLHGVISPSGLVMVLSGADQQFTITPDAGYHVAGVLVDGGSAGTVTSYTFHIVTADHTISATFAINTYTLAASAGANGTITPSGTQTVDYGTDHSYTIAPNVGYHVADVLVDGVSVGAVTSYSFTSVNANHSISATFAINTYELTATAGANGTITPTAIVNHGTDHTFTISANVGYHVADVTVDGVSVGAVTTYTFTNVVAPHAIVASFAINTYTLTSSAGANGAITPSATVNYGTDYTFTITPTVGYHVADVLVDGVSVGAVTSHTFTNVTAEHTISATFAINLYSLTVNSTAGGSVTKTPDEATYQHGSTVQLTATAAPNYHFVNWSGAASGTDNSVTITMDGDKTVSATFVLNTYALNVTQATGGTISKSPDLAAYDHGTSVQLTAVPAPGYHLVAWTGDASGSTNPTSITMDGIKSVSATFALNTYALNVTQATGGTITKSPDQASYEHGSSVQLTAAPAPGYHFVAWTGDASGSTNPTSVTMDGIKSVSATFALNAYSLTVTQATGGTITKSPDQATYEHGSSVQLTAAPAPGYHLVAWTGDASGSTNPLTIAMDGNKAVSATFALNAYSLTVTQATGGTISKSPDQASYEHGSSVQLTAALAPGYHFVGWTGDASGTTNPVTIAMDGNKAVSATFAINTYTLNASAGANGTITPSGSQTINSGANQTFAIAPNAGYHVADVLVDGISVGAVTTYTFTNVTANHTIAATFAFTDAEPPAITPPADITATVNNGSCGAVVNFPAPVVTDNVSIASVSVVPASGSTFPVGTTIVKITATDAAGNTSLSGFSITVTNTVPTLGEITTVSQSVTINSPFAVSAVLTDPDENETHAATWNWGDGATSAGVVSNSTLVSGTHSYTAAGTYTIALTVTDGCGAQATSTFQFTVNSTTTGSAVGAGWITSPAGAYASKPTYVGKGYFAFAAGYLGSNPVPVGVTTFVLKSGSLFSSTAFSFLSFHYESLVFSEGQGALSGTGKVNGSGNYGFLLTFNDGHATHTQDKLRMKIWNKNSGNAVFYDSQMGAPDDASPTATVNGGVITISKSGGSSAAMDLSIQEVLETEAAATLPTEYALHNAYPNPFNPSTTIKFDLPEAARVRLAVYDMLGREVAVLADGERVAGQHTVVFDAGRLASGMYIYRLQTDSYTQTKKLMLMK